MYSIAHHTLELDGVITEFADIYAPLAQIWKANATQVEEGRKRRTTLESLIKKAKNLFSSS